MQASFFLSCSGSVYPVLRNAQTLKTITFLSFQTSIWSIKLSDFICCYKPKYILTLLIKTNLQPERENLIFQGFQVLPLSPFLNSTVIPQLILLI